MATAYTISGEQDLWFSVQQDESAMVIQTFHREAKAKKVVVMNRNGDNVSVAAGHGPTVDIKTTGFKKNASSSNVIGTAVALANQTSVGGITPTVVILDSTAEDEDVENFIKIDNGYTGYKFPS